MSARGHTKKDFTTRLSEQTLARLDQLIRGGEFETRTAAIEAAVERLVEAELEHERKRRALDEACGVLHLGIDRERLEAAELDRLEYEVWKNTGKRQRRRGITLIARDDFDRYTDITLFKP